MEPRQKLFWEIKSLLLDAFANRIETNDSNGSFIGIKDTFFWMASNPDSLLVGFDHYHVNYSNSDIEKDPNQVYELFFKLLTNRIRITRYFKGNQMFKIISEIEIDDHNFEELFNVRALLRQYWKKTRKEIEFIPKIIEKATLQDYKDRHT
ncbi:hypothetical protein [Pedobacter chitinilyticus]|uniref:Uncharacterized protein n=1 Tax=Pedobacter chitinilyticus TaxID=2233776 RepID=A0A3S3PCB9_9SPHI|nr:hypothetical protein [Pedobacter chitinilyticus]RWU08399.1 hypothetical protein DPV69_08455 [Pedobacter chitinilyticus]